MIARAARPDRRSGITLTEILIAILIMGVGLISLATLFPLGLLRMKAATQYNRTGLLYESAADEMDARALLYKSSFIQTWYGPRDPFLYDATVAGAFNTTQAISSSTANISSGLPFAYDPLWRAVTGVVPLNANTGNALYDSTLDFQKGYYNAISEARFGAAVISGTAFNVRADPDTKTASGHGLQRLTNFIPYSSANFTPLYNFTHLNPSLTTQRADIAADVFASTDDIVFNPINNNKLNAASSLLPEQLNVTSPLLADYRFTWFFTGQQVDTTNSAQFVGDIVVCDSRPFAYDSVSINGQTAFLPAGETVVEAIFGFGTNFTGVSTSTGYSLGNKRSVLLRWPVGVPDPQIRPGGWIADVTYERNPTIYATRYMNAPLPVPFVRCHWYQVTKRTEAENETATSAGPKPTAAAPYRRMVVTIASDVRAQTLLNTSNASPVNLNFALVMPSVVNVFPRSFEVH